MTGSLPVAVGPAVGPAPPEGAPGDVRPAPGGRPGGPGRFRGRAQAFRHEFAHRQTLRNNRVANVVLTALIIVGAYALVTERPGNLLPGSTGSTPGAGTPVVVHLGAPSKSTVGCTGGGTAYAESVPWNGSTETLTTGEIVVRLYEVWDGDNIADPDAVANATATNLCAGSPPDATALWYVVLAAPNGTNLMTYTESGSWSAISGGSSNLEIDDGSFLVLVSYDSLAGTGRGLEVAGFAGTSEISGSVLL